MFTFDVLFALNYVLLWRGVHAVLENILKNFTSQKVISLEISVASSSGKSVNFHFDFIRCWLGFQSLKRLIWVTEDISFIKTEVFFYLLEIGQMDFSCRNSMLPVIKIITVQCWCHPYFSSLLENRYFPLLKTWLSPC